MKKLFLTLTFALLSSAAMFVPTQDAQAWWDDDDDYWDRPWYGGGPWYGGYRPYGYGWGYPYGGYGGYPYGGYPYGYADPYGAGAAPQGESTTTDESTTAPARPAYPAYQGYYGY